MYKANAVDTGLQQALQAFLGSSTSHVALVAHKSQENGQQVTVTKAAATKKSVEVPLVTAGFTRIHRFALLPSAWTTRWIIPMGNRHWTFRGLRVCTVSAPGARLLKRLLLAVTWMGWTGWARRELLVCSQQPLTVESLVSEVTREVHPVFALSLGTPGRYRKLTIQVMRQDGEVLGYVKLPLAHEAVARIRREAAMLEYLSRFSALQLQIPRVLYAGEWEGRYILFQSAGPSRSGPAEFGAPHQEFLKKLRSIDGIVKPGEALVEEIGALWRKTERDLDSEWHALGAAALMTASRELRKQNIQCGITHGDFAPWNTRIFDGRLFVFDWESAEWQSPHQWDIFHFNAQVSILLNRKTRRQLPSDRSSGERALCLLYLLDSVRHCLDEKSPDHQLALTKHRRLLMEELSA
jgi:Phosphotransferase enzyme family